MKQDRRSKRKGTDKSLSGIFAVARAAKVSVATVSRALNGVSSVDPKLAKRVRDTADSLGYVPSRLARAFVSGKSRLFGAVISEVTTSCFPEMIQCFEETSGRMGYGVIVGSATDDVCTMQECVNRMLEIKVAGIAVFRFGTENSLVERVDALSIPMIFIDASPLMANAFTIPIDYTRGFNEGVQHLAALGHRKIAFISGPKSLDLAVRRKTAFCSAVQGFGLSISPTYMIDGDHTLDGGIRAAEILLRLANPPTAIVCSNDMTAIGALHTIYREGLRVPDDLSVIGADDVHFGKFLTPPLTTIRLSTREIAESSAFALDRLSSGLGPLFPSPIHSGLVVRQTTSTPKVF